MDLKQRKLQRLKEYDYGQNGAYFITICTQDRLSLFASIENGKLELNHSGKMVFDKFIEIPKYYPTIVIDNFVVMPNHLHGIVMIHNERTTQNTRTTQDTGTTQGSFPTVTLSDCIQRFKTLTTKLYIDEVKKGNYPCFDKKIWQKSFHGHIIRNEHEYQEINEYIETNPLKWEEDKYFL